MLDLTRIVPCSFLSVIVNLLTIASQTTYLALCGPKNARLKMALGKGWPSLE